MLSFTVIVYHLRSAENGNTGIFHAEFQSLSSRQQSAHLADAETDALGRLDVAASSPNLGGMQVDRVSPLIVNELIAVYKRLSVDAGCQAPVRRGVQ